MPLLLEGLADLVDRVVLLAQGDGDLARGGLLRLRLRPASGSDEERRRPVAAKVVAQDAEGPGRGPKARATSARALLDEVGAQGLVLAVARGGGLAEEAPAVCYILWYA